MMAKPYGAFIIFYAKASPRSFAFEKYDCFDGKRQRIENGTNLRG